MLSENRTIVDLNTLRLSGIAAAYAEITSDFELTEALRYASERQLPVLPLGEGSNVVLGERLNRLLLRDKRQGYELLSEDKNQARLRVAAGQNWHELVQACIQQGWYGLENLALIPGGVGAAPVQNIGAYGVELAECIDVVSGIFLPADNTSQQGGEPWRLANAECQFGYRDSIFKHELRDKVLITSIEITLQKHFVAKLDYPSLAEYFDAHSMGRDTLSAGDVFDAVTAIRRARLPDPAEIPNAGSFFKNVVVSTDQYETLHGRYPDMPSFAMDGEPTLRKIPSAWLVEQCGFKGRNFDGIGMHSEQALVLVRKDPGAKAYGRQVLALAERITTAVLERFGLRLEIEPRVYDM